MGDYMLDGYLRDLAARQQRKARLILLALCALAAVSAVWLMVR